MDQDYLGIGYLMRREETKTVRVVMKKNVEGKRRREKPKKDVWVQSEYKGY